MTSIDRLVLQKAAGAAAFIASFVVLYGQVIRSMVEDWSTDPNYSHGFLIPAISGYFLWQRRDTLRNAVWRPYGPGIAVVLFGLALLLLGHLSGEYFTMRFSMLVVLAGAILFAAGTGVFKVVLFPLVYLVLMIPLPYLVYNAFAFPLKLFVSSISVGALQALGFSVLREGNIMIFPSTTLEVADACSGVRSIISLLALSVALAAVSLKKWWLRITLAVLAVPIAVVVNAARVIITGMLANRYGDRVAQGFYHEFAGVVIFGLAILLLGGAAWILSRFETSDKPV